MNIQEAKENQACWFFRGSVSPGHTTREQCGGQVFFPEKKRHPSKVDFGKNCMIWSGEGRGYYYPWLRKFNGQMISRVLRCIEDKRRFWNRLHFCPRWRGDARLSGELRIRPLLPTAYFPFFHAGNSTMMAMKENMAATYAVSQEYAGYKDLNEYLCRKRWSNMIVGRIMWRGYWMSFWMIKLQNHFHSWLFSLFCTYDY